VQKILDILYATEVSLMENWKFCNLLPSGLAQQ
jgi:hypothetical protein